MKSRGQGGKGLKHSIYRGQRHKTESMLLLDRVSPELRVFVFCFGLLFYFGGDVQKRGWRNT